MEMVDMGKDDDFWTKPIGFFQFGWTHESKEEMRHKEEMQRLKNEEIALRQGLLKERVVDVDELEDVSPRKRKLLPRMRIKQIEHF
jgi:hypothetical protein